MGRSFAKKIKLVWLNSLRLITLARPDPSLESRSQEYECFEASEEAVIHDVYPEPIQLQNLLRTKAIG